MLIRKLKDCELIIAGDKTRLKEILHPDRHKEFKGRYSVAWAEVEVGKSSIKHALTSSEVYYILSGKGRMHIDDESAEVESGDIIDIPPDAVQWIENISDENLQFLCIVDPAWHPDQEKVL